MMSLCMKVLIVWTFNGQTKIMRITYLHLCYEDKQFSCWFSIDCLTQVFLGDIQVSPLSQICDTMVTVNIKTLCCIFNKDLIFILISILNYSGQLSLLPSSQICIISPALSSYFSSAQALTRSFVSISCHPKFSCESPLWMQ